jgi:hypothetical protein
MKIQKNVNKIIDSLKNYGQNPVKVSDLKFQKDWNDKGCYTIGGGCSCGGTYLVSTLQFIYDDGTIQNLSKCTKCSNLKLSKIRFNHFI